MAKYKYSNGVRVQMTTEEENQFVANETAWINASADRKLAEIRTIRNKLLQNTDWKVTMAKEKGTTLSSGFKTWRDNLRKIPQDYDTETKYDELLAKDSDGNLTHSVWSE